MDDFVKQNLDYIAVDEQSGLDNTGSWERQTAIANGNIDVISEIDKMFSELQEEDELHGTETFNADHEFTTSVIRVLKLYRVQTILFPCNFVWTRKLL